MADSLTALSARRFNWAKGEMQTADYYHKNLGSLALQGHRGFYAKYRRFVQSQSNHYAVEV